MATTAVTVDEYLRTSFEDGDREYVDGEILERNLGELDHGDLQTAIAYYLRAHYPQYFTAVEVRVQVRSTRFRVPDLFLIAGPKPPGRIVTAPPHVVVEVLSPEDRVGYMSRKIGDYVAFGVAHIWVIDPVTREAWIYTREGGRPVSDGVLRAFNPDIEAPLAAL